MADGPPKDFRPRRLSRRNFITDGAKLAAGAVVGWQLHNKLGSFPSSSSSQIEASVIRSDINPEFPTTSPVSSLTPEVPTNPNSETTRDKQRKTNAEIAFKKHLAYYPGLLDDNSELKRIVEDPDYQFNDQQLTIETHPHLNSIIYSFRLDKNAKSKDKPDIQFISHENRPNLDDMLSVEFVIDHLGRIRPQMQDSPRKLSNDELKMMVGKMTQFAPEQWEDKTTFDPNLNQEILIGIQGNNDRSIPRSYVQAQQTGRVLLALFTPKSPPRAPGVVPKPGDVLSI